MNGPIEPSFPAARAPGRIWHRRISLQFRGLRQLFRPIIHRSFWKKAVDSCTRTKQVIELNENRFVHHGLVWRLLPAWRNDLGGREAALPFKATRRQFTPAKRPSAAIRSPRATIRKAPPR